VNAKTTERSTGRRQKKKTTLCLILQSCEEGKSPGMSFLLPNAERRPDQGKEWERKPSSEIYYWGDCRGFEWEVVLGSRR